MEIAKYLKQGDLTLIAQKAGYSRNTVYRVRNGRQKNDRIAHMIEQLGQKRKAELDDSVLE